MARETAWKSSTFILIRATRHGDWFTIADTLDAVNRTGGSPGIQVTHGGYINGVDPKRHVQQRGSAVAGANPGKTDKSGSGAGKQRNSEKDVAAGPSA